MKQKRLGNSEIMISAVGLGCMGLSHASGAPTEKSEAIKILRQAHEIGYTFFDTAECYTGINPDGSIHYNEEMVGDALRPVRDEVVIASKFGVHHNEDRSLRLDSKPETIRRSIDGTLKRMGLDYLDLYYQHRIDPEVEPEEVAGVMGELIKEGKIRTWGISETTEAYLRRAHAVTPVAAIENRYSMMARWHESIFPAVEELGLTYVAFSPMANGFLTGKYDANSKFDASTDYRANMPQYSPEGIEKSRALMEMLHAMAEKKQATPAQLSMAWMMCKKDYIVPIPGSRKIERLKENAGAADVILTAEEVARIDAALDQMDFIVFGGH